MKALAFGAVYWNVHFHSCKVDIKSAIILVNLIEIMNTLITELKISNKCWIIINKVRDDDNEYLSRWWQSVPCRWGLEYTDKTLCWSIKERDVQCMTLNCIEWLGSGSGAQRSRNYSLITITPRSPRTRNGSTCKDPIYLSNISVRILVWDRNTWNHTTVCKHNNNYLTI